MSDEQSFLQAILANPDDDTLRLIYADWLEERGDPRGEFIRVQIELAGAALTPFRRHNLIVRENELFHTLREALLRPYPGVVAEHRFARGFLDEVKSDAEVFLQYAVVYCQFAPLRRLKLRGAEKVFPQLLQSEYLGRLRSLDLSSNDLADVNIWNLAAAPFLAALHELVLDMNLIGMDGARALASSCHLANLRRLSLGHNPIEDLGLHSLVNSSYLDSLQELSVPNCDITDTGIRYLARSAFLAHLTALDLGDNQIGNGGLAVLAKSRWAARLHTLELGNNGINSRGLSALAASTLLGSLTSLSLRSNPISKDGALLLAECRLDGLQTLDLRDTLITRSAHEQLRERLGDRVLL
jgi:uncharacterized protein (TIGR02996 family)